MSLLDGHAAPRLRNGHLRQSLVYTVRALRQFQHPALERLFHQQLHLLDVVTMMRITSQVLSWQQHVLGAQEAIGTWELYLRKPHEVCYMIMKLLP